jgi:hypothetical protein
MQPHFLLYFTVLLSSIFVYRQLIQVFGSFPANIYRRSLYFHIILSCICHFRKIIKEIDFQRIQIRLFELSSIFRESRTFKIYFVGNTISAFIYSCIKANTPFTALAIYLVSFKPSQFLTITSTDPEYCPNMVPVITSFRIFPSQLFLSLLLFFLLL